MFNDYAGGFIIKGFYAFQSGICIGNVIVGEFFALQLKVVGQRTVDWRDVAIKGSGLMGVFAVAHLLHFFKMQIEGVRISRACGVLQIWA